MDMMCLRVLTFLVVCAVVAVAAEQLDVDDTESTTATNPANVVWNCFTTFPWKRPYYSCRPIMSSKRRALVDFRGMSVPYITNSKVPAGKWITRPLTTTTGKSQTVTKQDSGNWFLG